MKVLSILMVFFLKWDGNKGRSLRVVWGVSFLLMGKFISFGMDGKDVRMSIRCTESP